MKKKVKILLSGGGTMGSVSPLLAVYQEIQNRDFSSEFLFIGTKNGPEKASVESYKIPFVAIDSGKLRRYLDWRNFTDPFKIVRGFFQARKVLKDFNPDIVFIAGAFVGVPVALAARLKGVKLVVHQQDIERGLANKLMAPLADKVTVSFDVSLKDFMAKKVVLTGNPLRSDFHKCDKAKALSFFNLSEGLPTILITGGGTGSQKINQMVAGALPKILKSAQVIHTTGVGKGFNFEHENYHQYEFLSHEMPEALCAADVVVSRAGLSTLTELSICGKASVIIPLYHTHQEFNAQYYQKHNAVLTVAEPGLTSEMFADLLLNLLSDKSKMENLKDNIRKIMPIDGAKRVADVLMGLLN
jgi:UDP-N-acetylglucosamine--N-acetylmuramyl-(pentapeptide) pyrophosphoryl-undecaprenol N-acetylglucosamine transferase